MERRDGKGSEGWKGVRLNLAEAAPIAPEPTRDHPTHSSPGPKNFATIETFGHYRGLMHQRPSPPFRSLKIQSPVRHRRAICMCTGVPTAAAISAHALFDKLVETQLGLTHQTILRKCRAPSIGDSVIRASFVIRASDFDIPPHALPSWNAP
jgi:hypothetical protein